MTFGTSDTSPDLDHTDLNGTKVKLVSDGTVRRTDHVRYFTTATAVDVRISVKFYQGPRTNHLNFAFDQDPDSGFLNAI